MPATHAGHASFRAGTSAAIATSRGLQPAARSRRAPGAVAADVPGPHRRRRGTAYAGISCAYAGDATGQRDGGRGNIAESRPDHVFARSGKDSRPQQTGRGLLRMLWNDRAANEEM